MRIGVNLLFLLPGIVGGTETHALSLLQALARLDQENEYLVFVNRESVGLELPNQSNFKKIICPTPARFRPTRYFWEQSVLPFQTKKYRLDILHSPGYVQPLRLSCSSIVTIHDLNFHNLPQYFSPIKRTTLRFFVTHSAQKADHIITVSHFSKAQLVEILGVSEEKITVTYNAVRAQTPDILPITELTQRYAVQRPFILGLSSFSPHKNIPMLVRAFARVKEEVCADLQLVLAGHLPLNKGALYDLIKKEGLQNSIVFTGYVPDAVLPSLYAHAELFVFPSLYEGFGIPVLEAFAYGAPVACSDAAALPEIAGDAAYYFDPQNLDEIGETITRIIQDEPLRELLIERGKARLKLFSWEKSAKETLKLYKQIAGSSK